MIRTYISGINWRSRTTMSTIGLIALALIAGISFRMMSGTEAAPVVEDSAREVTVARVSNLMNGGSALSVVAEVTSKSEAKISPETGGRVTRVRASLGQNVSEGQVLAEVENGSQRAAVLQAEGVYDAAKASLQKVQGGTRDEQLAIKQSAVDAARNGAVNTLLTAYASVESAINDAADPLFTNLTVQPQFNVVVTTDSQTKLSLENTRGLFNGIIAREAAQANSISASADVKTELLKTEEEVRQTRVFMDNIIKALNAAVPSAEITQAEIDAYKASVAGARTSLTASLGAISSARTTLETAEKSLEEGVAGAVSEDIAGAEAAVKQAQGAYNAALANLEKTIIRSPISGTLNNFTIKLGDTIAPQQEVAIVSNNTALEAVAYLTEEDKARVVVGQEVAIEHGITGTITKIAPALDPVTRRIEIRIGLPATATKVLTNGQSVRVELSKDENAAPVAVEGPLSIPIAALKMEASRTIVFTVADNKLVAREIQIGKLSGQYVQVVSGIDANTEIVTDARGLKEGDEVRVRTQ